MKAKLQQWRGDKTVAHVAPFFIFMAFMLLSVLMEMTGFKSGFAWEPWYRRDPAQWIYPLQTLVTLGVLVFFWRNYDFKPVRGLVLATLLGLLGIFLWILPGHLFWTLGMEEGWWKNLGFTDRSEGFDPTILKEESGALFATGVFLRFFRMVVVVALVEEIFWRGFLMRFLLDRDGDYWKVPFGKATVFSFFVVTGLVTVVHQRPDWLAAFIWGSLVFGLAVRTKSLLACVWMHAVANLALGIYVMATGRWGYW